jgi:ABC-2 type transport system permease protein
MNTQASVMTPVPESPAMSALHPFCWSVRRELWENRSIYLVPLGVGALIVLATAINVMHMAPALHTAPLDPAMEHGGSETPFVFAALLLMFSTMVVAVFYSVDALYGERRDRSVLFWKSMPVSDTTTVLSKLVIPLLVLPLVTFAVTLVTQLIMLLFGVLRAGPGAFSHLGLEQLWWGELFHAVAFHGLWWAPFWGWFLLASAWSRRAPLLTAVLPPLVIGFVEKIAFGTSYFAHWVLFRFGGSMTGPPPSSPMSAGMLMQGGPLAFVTDIHLWTGFAMCAVCVALAVYLRKQRGPV